MQSSTDIPASPGPGPPLLVDGSLLLASPVADGNVVGSPVGSPVGELLVEHPIAAAAIHANSRLAFMWHLEHDGLQRPFRHDSELLGKCMRHSSPRRAGAHLPGIARDDRHLFGP